MAGSTKQLRQAWSAAANANMSRESVHSDVTSKSMQKMQGVWVQAVIIVQEMGSQRNK